MNTINEKRYNMVVFVHFYQNGFRSPAYAMGVVLGYNEGLSKTRRQIVDCKRLKKVSHSHYRNRRDTCHLVPGILRYLP